MSMAWLGAGSVLCPWEMGWTRPLNSPDLLWNDSGAGGLSWEVQSQVLAG